MGYLKCCDISGYDIDYIYQWDINRKVIIKGIDFDENMMIHICHVDSVEALNIEPTLSGNDIIVSIPNILLQRAAPVVLYFVRDSGNASSYTTQSLRITVVPRAKPSDYVYTETEVLTWKSLDERLNKVERNMSGIDEEDVANAVEDYLIKHPVIVTETDPTVPEWAKQKNKPSYTAQEVGALSAEALPVAVNEALAQAKASGAFDGVDGKPGADGKDGQNGADGYSPVKGVDYFTPEEVQEIAEQAAEMVEVPVSGGMTKTEKNLILQLFRNAVYTSAGMNPAFTQLETLWNGSGDDTGGGDTHSHSYTSSITTAATCTTAGVKTYTCNCGHSYTESIPATGHNYVDGVCAVCGASGVSNETEWTDGVEYTYDPVTASYIDNPSGEMVSYNGWSRTPHLYCDGAAKLRFEIVLTTSTIGQAQPSNEIYNAFYDENKNFIQNFSFAGIDGSTEGDYFDVDIPTNAVYFIVSHKDAVLGVNSGYNRPYIAITPLSGSGEDGGDDSGGTGDGGNTEETEVSNETKWTSGVSYKYTAESGVYIEKTDGTTKAAAAWASTPYLYCDGASVLRITAMNTSNEIGSGGSDWNAFYDSDKNFLSNFNYAGGISSNEIGSYTDVNIPENAVYFRMSAKTNCISDANSYGQAYMSITPYE